MIRYHRPRSLEEAVAIRAAGDVAVIAGGTDIYPAHAARRAWGEPTHKPVLDITAIPGLDRVDEIAEGWRIGCLVTWSALRRMPLPPLFDGLKAAAKEVGGAQVQNRGTIIGNLCTASPAGDGIPNLLALEAHVVLVGPGGRRALPLATFLTGYRATALRGDEIVTEMIVPRAANARGAFVKLGARRYLVISIAMAAGVLALEEERIASARIAVGACSAVAQRLPALEAALEGITLRDAAEVPQAAHLAHLSPIDDVRATAAYRRDAALTVTRDLLRELAA
jgi:N-methylhydantoinase B